MRPRSKYILRSEPFQFTVACERLKYCTPLFQFSVYHLFYVFSSLRKAFSELRTPSWKPITFAILLASSNRFRASTMFPSISANSPRLWVATAQPMSHSSVLSGGLICAATARAFSAHALALPTSAGRDTGGCPGVDGGFCCANEIDRLFTIACQNFSPPSTSLFFTVPRQSRGRVRDA